MIQDFFKYRPTDDVSLWRYLDIWKFEDLLATGKLFLCRVDKFPDQLEGTWPKQNQVSQRQRFEELAERHLRGEPPKGIAAHQKTEAELRSEVERLELALASLEGRKPDPTPPPFQLEDPLAILDRHRQNVAVNCWQQEKLEDAGMWAEYAPSKEGGVAIKSTARRLEIAISPEKGEMWGLGEVQYLNFADESIPETDMTLAFFFKDHSYKHEKELRVLVARPIGSFVTRPPGSSSSVAANHKLQRVLETLSPAARPIDGGVRVPVDLRDLLCEVVVSPNAPDHFREKVVRLLDEKGLGHVPVVASTASGHGRGDT